MKQRVLLFFIIIAFSVLSLSTAYSIERTALISWGDGKLKMALERSPLYRTYYITLGGDAARSDISVLQNSDDIRIVLAGYGATSKSTMKLRKEEFIKSVSVSTRDDDTVLSFSISNQDRYLSEWDSETRTLTVQEILSAPPPKIVRAGLIKSKTTSTTLTSKPPLPLDETEKETSLDDEIQEPKRQAPRDSTLSLQAIAFSEAQEEDTIRFTMNEWPEYQLHKTSEGVFVLTIDNARVSDDRLLLPRYAPASSKHFRYIIAKQEAQKLAINIVTEKGVNLDSRVSDNVLSLKPR